MSANTWVQKGLGARRMSARIVSAKSVECRVKIKIDTNCNWVQKRWIQKRLDTIEMSVKIVSAKCVEKSMIGGLKSAYVMRPKKLSANTLSWVHCSKVSFNLTTLCWTRVSGPFLLPSWYLALLLVEDDNSPISTAHQPVFLFLAEKEREWEEPSSLSKWIFYPSSSFFFLSSSTHSIWSKQTSESLKKATIGTLVISNGTQMFGHYFLSHSHIEIDYGNSFEIFVFGHFGLFW